MNRNDFFKEKEFDPKNTKINGMTNFEMASFMRYFDKIMDQKIIEVDQKIDRYKSDPQKGTVKDIIDENLSIQREILQLNTQCFKAFLQMMKGAQQ